MSIVRVGRQGKRMTREFRQLVAGHRLAAVGRGDLSDGAENKGWWLKTAARQNTAGKFCCFCPFSLFWGAEGEFGWSPGSPPSHVYQICQLEMSSVCVRAVSTSSGSGGGGGLTLSRSSCSRWDQPSQQVAPINTHTHKTSD